MQLFLQEFFMRWGGGGGGGASKGGRGAVTLHLLFPEWS